MKVLINVLLLIFAVSCQQNFKSKQTLVKVGQSTFDIGFYGKIKLSRIDGQEYISHADFTTHKKIVVSALSGKEEVVIPLGRVLEKIERIAAFEIVNWDSIFVLPAYSTGLLIIDTSGNIKGEIDFEPYLKQEGHYALVCHTGRFLFDDTTMIFALEYLAENVAGEYVDNLESLKAYDKGLYESPRLFKVDHFLADSLTVHFGASQLYKRFSAENVLAYGRSNFRFINGQIFFTNMYTDSVYVIDPEALTVEQSVGVSSKYTDLVLDHMTREEAVKDGERFMYNSMSNGNIRDVLYDSISQHYFVALVHQPKSSDQMASLESWSFVVLDKSLNYVDEIYMDYDEFGYTNIPSTQGLFLLNTQASQTGDKPYEYYDYTIFHYK